MPDIPKKLNEKLIGREAQDALRHLPLKNDLVDFSSNDYLGFSRNSEIFNAAAQLLSDKGIIRNGATGSRLLSGNHALYGELERSLSEFHNTRAALVFNSGYAANIGFFGNVPQRGDVVFYDEFIHASIRDGIKLGNAKSHKFKHNDLNDLKGKCHTARSSNALGTEIYVVTESVFSMDGDSPDLKAFIEFCHGNDCRLIVDEAHAVGVFGEKGKGMVQQLGLEKEIFARIITFGKAIGCHGAAILGSERLKGYLINFARSFIYTTGLPPHSVATISSAYAYLESNGVMQKRLKENILFFDRKLETLNLKPFFLPSDSAIHCCIIPGNENVRRIADEFRKKGFDLKPILSPTVPKDSERLRFCLHSFNTEQEIVQVLQLLAIFTKEA